MEVANNFHTIISYHDNGVIETEYTCTICEQSNSDINYIDYEHTINCSNSDNTENGNIDEYTVLKIVNNGFYRTYTPDSVMTLSAEYVNGELNGEKRELIKYVEGTRTILIISDYVYGKCSGFVCYAHADYLAGDLTPITFIRFEYWINDNMICRNDKEIRNYMNNNYIPKKDALMFSYIRDCNYRKIVDKYKMTHPNRIHTVQKIGTVFNSLQNYALTLFY